MTEHRMADIHTEHRRLCILRTLLVAPGMSANDSILETSLRDFRLRAGREQIRHDIRWLEVERLVTVEALGTAGGMLLATLAPAGQDVAEGRFRHSGVATAAPRG